MNPYYSDDLVTVYHGRCEDILPTLPAEFDLVFTSPPYNLGTTTGGGFAQQTEGAEAQRAGGKWTGGALAAGYEDHDDAMPMDEYEAWQQGVLRLCWERLNDAGAVYYNHKPRVQDGELWLPLRLNPGLPLRQIVTWARSGGMNFAPTHYVPTYEWILVLAKPDFRLKSKAASGVGDLWRVPQETNS